MISDEPKTKINRWLITAGIVAMMGVIVIFGLIIFRSTGASDEASVAAARTQMATMISALGAYRLDTDTYPSTEQGLRALLVRPPDAIRWRGPYLLEDISKDPWRREWVYTYPGLHGDEPDIMCLGADGEAGGEGVNADIVSWAR